MSENTEFIGYEKIVINENTNVSDETINIENINKTKSLTEIDFSKLQEYILNKSIGFFNECIITYLNEENVAYKESDVFTIKEKLLQE